MVKLTLKQDVYSHTNRGGKPLIYGRQHEQVTLIKAMDHVLLVQDANGNKYPVNASKTDYDPANQYNRTETPAIQNAVEQMALEPHQELCTQNQPDNRGNAAVHQAALW